jgi:hypothetical protein
MTAAGLILLTSLSLACPSAWSAMYKWTDEHGKVHYGDSIPAQESDLGHKELDNLGRVRNKVERTRLSPAEKQQRVAEELQRKRAQREEAEQNRHDRALMSTYADVGEIDLARERALALEMQQLNGLQNLLNKALEKHASAHKQITRAEALDQVPSRNLVDMRREADLDISHYKILVAQREKIIAEQKARFEADRKRYLELRQRLLNR